MSSKIFNKKQNLLYTAMAIALIAIAPSTKTMKFAKMLPKLLKRTKFTQPIKVIKFDSKITEDESNLWLLSNRILCDEEPTILIHEDSNEIKKLRLEKSFLELANEELPRLNKSNMKKNIEISDFLQEKGINAIGIDPLCIAEKTEINRHEVKINSEIIENLMKDGIVPIIAASLVYANSNARYLDFISAEELAYCLASLLIDSSVLTEDDYHYFKPHPFAGAKQEIIKFVNYMRFIQEFDPEILPCKL